MFKESSKYLARKHDSEYKSGNRDTRAMYTDFMRGELGKVRGEDGQYSRVYDLAKLGEYSPNTFSEADDIVHNNVEAYSERLKNQFGGTGEGVKAGIAALRTSIAGRKAKKAGWSYRPAIALGV